MAKSGEYSGGVSFTFVVVKIRIDVGRYREEKLLLSKMEKNPYHKFRFLSVA